MSRLNIVQPMPVNSTLVSSMPAKPEPTWFDKFLNLVPYLICIGIVVGVTIWLLYHFKVLGSDGSRGLVPGQYQLVVNNGAAGLASAAFAGISEPILMGYRQLPNKFYAIRWPARTYQYKNGSSEFIDLFLPAGQALELNDVFMMPEIIDNNTRIIGPYKINTPLTFQYVDSSSGATTLTNFICPVGTTLEVNFDSQLNAEYIFHDINNPNYSAENLTSETNSPKINMRFTAPAKTKWEMPTADMVAIMPVDL